MAVGIDLSDQPAFDDPGALRLAAGAAEQLGYTSLWVAHASGTRGGPPAATVAAVTERLRVGVALDRGAGEGGPPHRLGAVDRSRLIVVVGRGATAGRHGWGRATVLHAGLPSRPGTLPAGVAGWSPLDPTPAQLLGVVPRIARRRPLLVARVRVRLAAAPVPSGRPPWCGSPGQVAGDIAGTLAAGATEVVVALDGRPGLDEALARWATLAEAVEAATAG